MTLRMAGPLLAALALTACGSSEQPPVEQIVVREPGETAAGGDAPEDTNASGDLVEAGKAAFAACASCHVVRPGAASGFGPNLYGVVGRAAGSLDGFDYSEALANSEITWTTEELDAFLANPVAKVPGTTMVAGSVSDAERRAALIAYLATLSQ